MSDITGAPHPLAGKRILICGKGGSGKSTFVALAAGSLLRRSYEVLVLDGDASNPEGLVRLLFGGGVEAEPRPLIDFFGGIDVVTCPVDDPAPLTRVGDTRPVPEYRVDLERELPAEYFLADRRLRLLQAGKIAQYGQGCDGPVEKVVRDFMVQGEAAQLIDTKAGVEHFGRRIPDRVDLLVTVLDLTLESVSIAARVARFCEAAGIDRLFFVVNKVGAPEATALFRDKLGPEGERVIGYVPFDPRVQEASLLGGTVPEGAAAAEIAKIFGRLEEAVGPSR